MPRFPELYSQEEIRRADRIRRVRDLLPDIAAGIAFFVIVAALFVVAGVLMP